MLICDHDKPVTQSFNKSIAESFIASNVSTSEASVRILRLGNVSLFVGLKVVTRYKNNKNQFEGGQQCSIRSEIID